MREYSSPLTLALPRHGNICDDIVHNAEHRPERAAFSRPVISPAGRTWAPVTAAAFLAQVRAVAKGLVMAGIQTGDRVVVLGRTRYEWTLTDYALWYCGAVGVPVYETSSQEQVAWILGDAQPRAAIVDTPAQATRVRDAAAGLLGDVWTLDGSPGAVAELTAAGTAVPDQDLEERRGALTPDHVATLIYTSGTTGMPRGCVLTHGAVMTEVSVANHELADLLAHDDAATLLVLPMAHVFARVIQVGAVRAGVRLGHVADFRQLETELVDFAPTFLLGVPRVFEKLFNAASQRAAVDGRSRLFDRATEVAIAWSQAADRPRGGRRARHRGGGPGPALRAQHALMERLVYARFRASLGGRCRYAVSGGAPLGERLGHFYRGAGVPVVEGYGLTETTGAVTVNPPDAIRVGSVGRPLPGTTIRVAPDGELLIRGGQVMRGYWNDAAATAEVLDAHRWLHSGDLGEIDAEGYVRITGRKKEIIVTASGKNVAAGMLETRVRAHPLVDQCLVVGDGRPYVAALVTLDPEAVADWARSRSVRGSLASLAADPDLRTEVQQAVDAANRTVSQAEWIRRVEVLPVTWSEETGELTASLKVRRNVVLRRYRQQIESLYL